MALKFQPSQTTKVTKDRKNRKGLTQVKAI